MSRFLGPVLGEEGQILTHVAEFGPPQVRTRPSENVISDQVIEVSLLNENGGGWVSKIPCDEEELRGTEESKVRVKVVAWQSVEKRDCAAGHSLGDEAEVAGEVMTKGRICIWAYQVLHPIIMNRRFGLRTPYEKGDVVRIPCPDPTGIVFEVSSGEKLPRPTTVKQQQTALRRSLKT